MKKPSNAARMKKARVARNERVSARSGASTLRPHFGRRNEFEPDMDTDGLRGCERGDAGLLALQESRQLSDETTRAVLQVPPLRA